MPLRGGGGGGGGGTHIDMYVKKPGLLIIPFSA